MTILNGGYVFHSIVFRWLSHFTQGFLVQENLTAVMFVFLHSVIFDAFSTQGCLVQGIALGATLHAFLSFHLVSMWVCARSILVLDLLYYCYSG